MAFLGIIPHSRSATAITRNKHSNVQLTLLIPDLLPPPGAERITADTAPILRSMCGRGTAQLFASVDIEIWLCQAFEVEKQMNWPVAPLTALVDALPAESGCWIRADPVHLQLQRNRSVLLAAPLLEPTAAEAAALTDTLNAHFAADGIRIAAPHPARWYINHPDAAVIPGPALSGVAGRPLPRTQLGGHWHRWLTECQMLMHEHAVNISREQRGLPAINSLLLWGGGSKPAVPGRHFSHVWSADPLATALAVQSGAESSIQPNTAAAWLGTLSGKSVTAGARHLIILEHVLHAARYGGPDPWMQSVAALEDGWFAPLWSALGKSIEALDIVATNPDQCMRMVLRPADKMKFWKRTPDWSTLTGVRML